ncbi:MAG TPA: MBL fold metallo-hydrolase [Actinomycetota bacterium]|nr:MBL fold metallo-hydrolase [Actinomycetota bacterium]
MKVTIWGCRGSLASPGPETVRFGGQTSCVTVHLSDGSLLILDAGTGIRPLGMALGHDHPKRIDIFITHLHTDHIEGLRFFDPIWDPSVELNVWGPPSPIRELRSRIAPYFAPPFFPVHLRNIPSHPEFRDTPTTTWRIGSAAVTAQLVKHPGPTVGYRVEENGAALAYLPDHEPALGSDLSTVEAEWISGNALAEGAAVLLHDAQYTQEEYVERVGWGHSSTEDVVTFARRAGSRRLVLFHHDPLHTDEQLERILARASELRASGDAEVELAREGMTFEL